MSGNGGPKSATASECIGRESPQGRSCSIWPVLSTGLAAYPVRPWAFGRCILLRCIETLYLMLDVVSLMSRIGPRQHPSKTRACFHCPEWILTISPHSIGLPKPSTLVSILSFDAQWRRTGQLSHCILLVDVRAALRCISSKIERPALVLSLLSIVRQSSCSDVEFLGNDATQEAVENWKWGLESNDLVSDAQTTSLR
jgi:hypothetical protein